ncbi:MAG TPA: hypothetical protein VLX44_00870 [Xanthobacteraceae bacterium]|nr:hypothetical protein [Xanthobacteraceae bacterium]
MIDVHQSGTRQDGSPAPRGRAVRRMLLGFARRLLIAMHESRRRQAEEVLRRHGVLLRADWAPPPVAIPAQRAAGTTPSAPRGRHRGATRRRLTATS